MTSSEPTRFWWGPGGVSRRAALRGAALGGAGLAAAALVGCGDDDEDDAPPSGAQQDGKPAQPAAGEPKRGGTLIASQTQSYKDVFDPHTSLFQAAFFYTYCGNLALRPSLDATKLEPELVQSWEIKPDGTEITLKVRPGVVWHNKPPTNGRALVADDVAFSIMRIAAKLNPDKAASFQRASTIPNLDSATAVDDSTVRIKLTKPHSSFLNGLSDWRNTILPRDFVEKGGKFEDPTALVGTGPFTVESYQTDVKAVFKPVPTYWEKGKPYVDAVQWVWITDRAANLAAFSKGEVDWFQGPTRTEQQVLKGTPNLREESWVFGNWNHFRFNTARDPFKDARVRRAMQRVFDYKKMGDSYYGEGKWEFSGPLSAAFPEALPSSEIAKLPGYNPSTKQNDIKEAKDLMSAAGFPDGKLNFKIMVFTQTGVFYDNAVRGSDDLKTVWPAMSVAIDIPPDTTTFSRRQIAGDFDFISYTLFPAPDAAIEMNQNYGSKGSRNYGKYADAKVDEALDKAASQIDLKQRAETLKGVQRQLVDDVPMILSSMNHYITYFTSRVKGMTNFGGRLGGGGYDIIGNVRNAWIDK